MKKKMMTFIILSLPLTHIHILNISRIGYLAQRDSGGFYALSPYVHTSVHQYVIRSLCCCIHLSWDVSPGPGCSPRQPLDRWPLQKLTTISLPGTPTSSWCYDTAVTDDGTYYLADNDRAGIDVIHDGPHPTYEGIIGKGSFTGIEGCKSGNYDTNGPEGLVIAHNQIFAGNGDSSVRVYSTHGNFIAKI